jgi:hypothetical protein
LSIQTLLVIGGMAILANLNLLVNGTIILSQESTFDNEAILTANGLAQSMLRSVTARAFDEKTIAREVTSPDSLTLPAALGPEAGEVSANYDDIDDYDGYVETINTARLGSFTVSVVVDYTTAALGGNPSLVPTFFKRVQVTVSGNKYLKQNVVLKTVVAY